MLEAVGILLPGAGALGESPSRREPVLVTVTLAGIIFLLGYVVVELLRPMITTPCLEWSLFGVMVAFDAGGAMVVVWRGPQICS